MSYDLDTQRTSNHSPRSKYGYASKPVGITIHHWGSDGQKHDNVVRWLRGSAGGVNNRNSSAHYVTSAGRVTRLADDKRATWHAGNNRGNGSTIGIECRPEMSDGDWDTLVELCADLEEKHGSLKYWKHSDWKNTACPGRYGSRIGELVDAINAEHKRRKSGGAKPAPKPQPKPSGKAPAFPLPSGHWFGVESKNPKNHSGYYKSDRAGIRKWQAKMRDRGWTISVDGIFGPGSAKVASQFQREKSLREDNAVGHETWAATWEEPVT
ncbi:peptidoglycan recognition protein family protein [Microbacterium sp.]|uniref:peptidoglycan recognition protein family protein n=1 Tax=Microbacterium sp. TaxID=51671 RepID=UPI003F9B2118